METQNEEFEICSNCGSRNFLKDYPSPGKEICGKCGHEITKIKLKNIETKQQIADQCPFCGKEGEPDDALFETTIIRIFKCKGCGKLDGYICYNENGDLEPDDNSYDPLSVKIARHEGEPILSATKAGEIEKALGEKEKNPVEKCKKQLNLIVRNKRREIEEVGISPETIERARNEVHMLLERRSPLTGRQLSTVFAASLSLMQKTNHQKSLEKKATGVQLEKIFGVTRKTIRKWRQILQENSSFNKSQF
jgi:transcription initiation factor TFIIIB Brf1 subunit/transcription initiation factor TFIIB